MIMYLQREAGGEHPRVQLGLQSREPKVDNLDLRALLALRVKQQVLGLEVPVHHAQAVHVGHAGHL